MKICFICGANVCRSYVSQELFNYYAVLKNAGANASSAGIFAQSRYEIPQKVKDYLESKGAKAAAHTPRLVSRRDLEFSDLILVMENSHYEILTDKFSQFTDKIYLFNDYVFGKENDISDPISKNGPRFIKAMDFLDNAVKVLLDKIKTKEVTV
jgi:protein-tyrosine-phosphatase